MAAKLILALRRRYNLSVLDTKGMNSEYGSISPCLGTQRSLLSYQRKSLQTSASGFQLSPKIAACANFLLEETELDPRHSVGFHWLFIVWTVSWATHFNWPWLEQGGWTRWALQAPSNLSQPVILWFICFLFSDSYSNARPGPGAADWSCKWVISTPLAYLFSRSWCSLVALWSICQVSLLWDKTL